MENNTLLTITFHDPIVRSLAMRAVAEAYGEDGWMACTSDDNAAERKYPATIVCCDTVDAVKTAYSIIQAFETGYQTSLHGHGLEISYKGV